MTRVKWRGIPELRGTGIFYKGVGRYAEWADVLREPHIEYLLRQFPGSRFFVDSAAYGRTWFLMWQWRPRFRPKRLGVCSDAIFPELPLISRSPSLAEVACLLDAWYTRQEASWDYPRLLEKICHFAGVWPPDTCVGRDGYRSIRDCVRQPSQPQATWPGSPRVIDIQVEDGR